MTRRGLSIKKCDQSAVPVDLCFNGEMKTCDCRHETRTEDEIDDRLHALTWRIYTDPSALRPLRYATGAIAVHAWNYMDRYVEWSRHRGQPIL